MRTAPPNPTVTYDPSLPFFLISYEVESRQIVYRYPALKQLFFAFWLTYLAHVSSLFFCSSSPRRQEQEQQSSRAVKPAQAKAANLERVSLKTTETLPSNMQPGDGTDQLVYQWPSHSHSELLAWTSCVQMF
eukprot:928975-Pelagomonas_calceolata.AAC.1